MNRTQRYWAIVAAGVAALVLLGIWDQYRIDRPRMVCDRWVSVAKATSLCGAWHLEEKS